MNKSQFIRYVMIFLIILSGVILRFHNSNWDNGLLFHPDELNIGIAVSKIKLFTNLDPEFYAYNGLTIYLYKALGHVAAFFTDNPAWHTDLSKILLIGRHVSAIVSSISSGLIYILARRFFDAQTAFFALALSAFNAGLIQCAHFAVTESLLVFFLLLIALLADLCQQRERPVVRFLLGIVCALAIACKTSALSFLLIPVSAWLMNQPGRQSPAVIARRAVFYCFIIIAVFFITSPYSLINYQAFARSMAYEGGVVHGSVRVPYTLQFHDTTPFVPWLGSLYWLCSPLPVITGGVAMLVLLTSGIRLFSDRTRVLPILLFAFFYALYIGTWHTKFVRYLVPLLPVILLCSAWACTRVKARFNRIGTFIIIAVIGSSGIWGASFFSIYCRPSTRIAASKWVYENIPEKSKILLEHYDYALPVPIGEKSPTVFSRRVFPFYDEDNPAKMRSLAEALAESDLIILASRRLYSTIPKDSVKYPFTARYYADLFAGSLGFSETARFASPPGIASWLICDDNAEETFQVFDHPTVRIFVRDKNPPPCGHSPEEIEAFLVRPFSVSDTINTGEPHK